MNDLLKVNYETETPTVSARDLYDIVSADGGTTGTERFSKWFERYIGYGFEQGKDFSTPNKKVRVQIEGEREVAREVDDYDLTVETAKQICMLQRTEKGKEIRQYFIDLEKAWNTPDQVMARALKLADRTIDSLKTLLVEQKPKVDFFDQVANSKTALPMDQVAKVLNTGIGRNKLFEILREKKILNSDNIPYQAFIDRGYFRVIEQKFTKPNGETQINIKTLVYQRGIDYIRKIVA